MFVDEFRENFLISFAPFGVQDRYESFEKLGSDFLLLFTFVLKFNDRTTGVEWFDDFIFIIAGKDEPTV